MRHQIARCGDPLRIGIWWIQIDTSSDPALQHVNICLQMIMSEAAAAGIHRSGMRRHAFSTGDLQALLPDPDEAPLILGPPPPSVLRMTSISLRTPRLESVPEGCVTHLTSIGAIDSTR